MTGLSLREQLLQAGLVSEKQVKQAEQSQKRQNFTDRKQVGKKDRNFREEQRQAELQQQAAAKAAKDAALNKKREEKAAAKARWAEIRQLVEQNRIAKPESDDYFNFVINGKVGRIRWMRRRVSASSAAKSRSSAATALRTVAGGDGSARQGT
jgi:hypothetical protein